MLEDKTNCLHVRLDYSGDRWRETKRGRDRQRKIKIDREGQSEVEREFDLNGCTT